jgi:hypothetical protein
MIPVARAELHETDEHVARHQANTTSNFGKPSGWWLG